MAQYTPTLLSNGSGVDADDINRELQAIQTAHNSHATGDFGSGVVPNSALAYPKADFFLPIVFAGGNPIRDTIPASAAYTDEQASVALPIDCTLVDVHWCCLAVAGTGDHKVKLVHGGADVTTAQEIAAADTGYGTLPLLTAFTANEIISIVAQTAAGCTIGGLSCVLCLKANHVS